jgi:hypothetical protein
VNTRSQVACAGVGFAGLGLILVGMIVGRYIPAPPAYWTADELAGFYRESPLRIQIGVLILLVATVGWATLMAAVSAQLGRIEGARTLRKLQNVTGTAVYLLLTLFGVFLGAAAFRPERSAEVTQALHDVGWFMAFLAAPAFMAQAIAVGLAVLSQRGPDRVYPRWLGYTGLWVALLLLPGMLLLCFHTGPFAYHGLIAYWLALFTFGGWMGAQCLAVLLAARAEARAGTPAPTPAAA